VVGAEPVETALVAPRSTDAAGWGGRRSIPSEAALCALRESATELEQTAAVVAACGADPSATTVAEGDRLLLAVHRALADADLELPLRCPDCGEVSAVRLGPDTVPPAVPRSAVLGTGGGLRQPTYGDLAGLPDRAEPAAEALLARCVVGTPSRPPAEWDLEAIDDSLVGPMTFTCAGCGDEVDHPLDVQTTALRALVRLIDAYDFEVHLLASVYHWTLETIEGLPRQRRRRLTALIADGQRAG
jgi:hypothetical protein